MAIRFAALTTTLSIYRNNVGMPKVVRRHPRGQVILEVRLETDGGSEYEKKLTLQR